MQDSFEKRVQEKLDELKLNPSTPVWEKIELQIQPEKKRRRAFFWLFFLLFLIVGGGAFYLSQITSDGKKLVLQTVNAAKGERPSSDKRTNKRENTNPSQSENPVATKHENKESTIELKSAAARERKVNTNESMSVSARKDLRNNDVVYSTEKKTTPFHTPEQLKSDLNSGHELRETEKTKPIEPATQQIQATEQTASFADSGKNSLQPTTIPKPLASDSTQAKKKVASAGKKWQKQILLQAGWSSYLPLSSFNYSNPQFYSTSPGSGISNAGGEGPVSKGVALAAGVGFSRAISARWTFTAGVQYAYYSTQSKVGSFRRIDTLISSGSNNFSADKSTVSGYYVVGQQEVHNNAFHFVEIPVGVSYQLLKKTPLRLSAGAVYGRLLHTTALTYNPSAGIYYVDETASNKQSVGLFTSLQYTVGKGKPTISFGPKLQYGATAVQKESTGSKRHLWFAGLQTSIHF